VSGSCTKKQCSGSSGLATSESTAAWSGRTAKSSCRVHCVRCSADARGCRRARGSRYCIRRGLACDGGARTWKIWGNHRNNVWGTRTWGAVGDGRMQSSIGARLLLRGAPLVALTRDGVRHEEHLYRCHDCPSPAEECGRTAGIPPAPFPPTKMTRRARAACAVARARTDPESGPRTMKKEVVQRSTFRSTNGGKCRTCQPSPTAPLDHRTAAVCPAAVNPSAAASTTPQPLPQKRALAYPCGGGGGAAPFQALGQTWPR